MSIFDRLVQQALDKQRKELEEYYAAEDKYIKDVKIELRRRIDKSNEYRIALQNYLKKLQEKELKLQEREFAINKKELELNAEKASLKEKVAAEVKKEFVTEKMSFELQKRDWLEYEKDLRRTEFTLLDWFKRLDRKEREIFDEILSDVNKYKEYSKTTPQMDGFQFEQYVAGLLMRNGYTNVIVTQKSGDYGADITAERQEVKYVIQCKYYSSQVGIEAVQQIYAAKIHYNANVAVVATNSVYTRAAETLAKDLGVVLWEGKELNDMFGADLN